MADGRIPTSYLIEKLGHLERSFRRVEGRPWIEAQEPELDWIRQNAKAIVDEIDNWRADPDKSSVIVSHVPCCCGHQSDRHWTGTSMCEVPDCDCERYEVAF